MAEIESRDEEDENGHNERQQKSQDFATNEITVILLLGVEKGSSNSRDIEEHGDSDLDQCLDDSVFLLLDGGIDFRVEATCIKRIHQAVHKNDEYNSHGSNPIGVEDSFLRLFFLLLSLFVLRLEVESVDVLTSICLPALA